jgi:hypothetical protein
MFTIGLINNVTGPANNVTHALNQIGDAGQNISTLGNLSFSATPFATLTNELGEISEKLDQAVENISKGAVGIAGALLSFEALTARAEDLNKSLRMVSTMDVGDAGLDKLRNAAYDFTAQFGGADDAINTFVGSAYNIKSALSDLTENELADFTTIAAKLALGTQSQADVMTSYIGTMAGLQKDEMARMGKLPWLENLAAQTATAVKLFKTTGSGLADAFSSLGPAASGVDSAEKFAVLGGLSSSMQGSVAGTKYAAFLGGISKAQDGLKLKFTDSNNHLLPMVDILTKIKGKYHDLDSVANKAIFNKAFGTDQAGDLIGILGKDLPALQNNIAALGVSNMQTVTDMANKMADPNPWLVLKTKASNVFFGIVDPNVNDPLDVLYNKLIRYIDLFPNLTKLAGETVFGFILLGGAIGTIYLAIGMGQAVWAGFLGVLSVLKFALTPLAPLFRELKVAWRLALMEFHAGGGIFNSAKVGLGRLLY